MSAGEQGPTLGVGMVGHAFMGAAHSQAWRTAPHFFDLPLVPAMVALAGRDAASSAEAARRLGWGSSTHDWRELLSRDDVQVVDVCTPGDTHAEIAVAALESGRHVLCEKPLANTVEEAVLMAQAAERAAQRGVRSMVAFNYRRVPAVALARRLVQRGRLGEVRHVRASYQQDWLVDPAAPLVWRLRKERAGSGALGDIGAHIVDAAQFVVGEVLSGVSGMVQTFVAERPLPPDGSGVSQGTGQVSVDDAAVFFARFASGALATFEATRFAHGRRNAMRFEVNGSRGSLAFDMERMNELQYFDGSDERATAGFRRILVTEPDHPFVGAWWPPGHGLGYEHSFTHQVVDLVTDIAQGRDPVPSFADGLQVQRVLAAVEASSADGCAWQALPG